MNTNLTTKKNIARTIALLAASLLLAASGVGQAVFAQEMPGLGPDQESLLPPEVVPLDPSAANRMMQSQAQARAAQMSAPEMQASPGMLTTDPSNGMQSAQDARNAAYNQLMGQGNAQPLNRNYANQYPGPQQGGPPGFTSYSQLSNSNSGFGQPMQQGQQGQQGQMANNNYGGPSGPNGQPGQSGWVQPGQGGTQTLTGGVANQVQGRQSIKRGGISNAVSAVAGLGTGLFLGSLVSRSMYSSPMGLGMFGLGATGFGMRNGFRW